MVHYYFLGDHFLWYCVFFFFFQRQSVRLSMNKFSTGLFTWERSSVSLLPRV